MRVEDLLTILIIKIDAAQTAILLITLIVEVEKTSFRDSGALRLNEDFTDEALVANFLHFSLSAVREDEIILMLTIEVANTDDMSLKVQFMGQRLLIVLFSLPVGDDIRRESRNKLFLH